MIRFWITNIWQHEALKGYTTLVRLDSDACWTTPASSSWWSFLPRQAPILPTLPPNKVYHANIRKQDSICQGFRDLVLGYVKQHKILPTNKHLYRTWRWSKCLSFYNNFEITRIDFMQQPEVVQWHEALTEQAPFGVFRERWGDAMERFVTMALFASPSMIQETKPVGYQHPCESVEVH